MILPFPPPGPSPVRTETSNPLSISDPLHPFPQAWLVYITAPGSALGHPPRPPYLGAAAQWAIGGAAYDTPVQTLTHRAGASTPAFPSTVHEAPLLTALTGLSLAPETETSYSLRERGAHSVPPATGWTKGLLRLRTFSNKTGEILGKRSVTL